MMWLHRVSFAFSFLSFFSPPLLEPVSPLISLGIKSKATSFGQRKGQADISRLLPCNGERWRQKSKGTEAALGTSLMPPLGTAHANSSNRSQRSFPSVLVVLLPNNLNA